MGELPGAAVAAAAEAVLAVIEDLQLPQRYAEALAYRLAREAVAAVLDDDIAADAFVVQRDRQLRDASRFAP